MPDLRKTPTDPPATGNTNKSIIFSSKTDQRADNVFDMFVIAVGGTPARLDRIAVKTTFGATPHALPRYGDKWLDPETDHLFTWSTNGIQNCWMDIS